MTEKEKQLAGMIYDASTPELVAEMDANKLRIQAYNNLPPTDVEARDKAMREILGSAGKDCCIVQPFYCDYGTQIHFGDGVFANFTFTVLEEAPV